MKKNLMRAVALLTICLFTTANVALAAGASVGIGNFSVYKNGKLVTKLTGQNPVEDGSLLVCDGKCIIKSEGISLIGKNQAAVAVANEDDTFRLFVKQGSVDFVINNNMRKIAFYTPGGTYTVADVIFNASSQAVVKGSVVVDNAGNTEISVSEGRMVFATDEGMKTVDADNKLVLAVNPGAAGGGALGLSAKAWGWIIGGVAVVGGTTAIIVANDDDDDDPAPVATTTTTTTTYTPTYIPPSPASPAN